MTLDRAVVQRMATDGLTHAKIGYYLGVSRSAVSHCLISPESDEPHAPVGRPSQLTKEAETTIRDAFATNPYTHLSELVDVVSPSVTVRTLENWLHQMGLRPATAILRRYLSPSHLVERVAFAQAHQHRNQHLYMFADECQFDTEGRKHPCWIPEGDNRPVIHFPNPPIRVQIFAAISWHAGKSQLVFLPRGTRNTAKDYLKLLKTCFSSDPFFKNPKHTHFYHDNSPIHSGEDTADFIDGKGLSLPKSPANSPELNPIENVWALMKKRMPVERPTTIDEMKRAIQRSYDSISKKEIKKMIDHLAEVKRKLLAENGGHVAGE